jgi:hypothetical protein
MLNMISAPSAARIEPPDRGLLWGVLVSLILHVLLLALQFGVPGLRPGPGGSLTVQLVPLRADAAPQEALAAEQSIVPAAPAPHQDLVQAPQGPTQGFSLLDPLRPAVVARPPAALPRLRAPRRHAPARVPAPAIRPGLQTKVIAQDVRKDDSFVVPSAASEPTLRAEAGANAADIQPVPAGPDNAQARQLDAPPASPEPETESGPSEAERQAERERLSAQREQERAARREADDASLRAAADLDARRAADQQARLLAQQAARYDDELAGRQRLADEERRRADDALARSREDERQQAAARQLAEQQRIQAEQARAQQQLAEQQRMQAEQTERAERLARLQQPSRPLDTARDAGSPARAATPAGSGLDSSGRGAGVLPRADLASPLASRARDLLRGIDIDKPMPQAMRPAEDARRQARRAQADAVQHDVPLRMYIDSIRQKIERNAIVSPSQLAGDVARIFPIVSITVRSDGSIEDVAIVRSSGRSDIDEVVRRIVHLNARYAAFPPNVAAHYDVIELRRVWSFAGVLRLLEEMR